MARRHPDYSAERRRIALSILREARQEATWSLLSDDSRVAYALGIVLCDKNGRFSKESLSAALDDPSAVNYARRLVEECEREAMP